jgi:hypothetical protein
MHMQESTPPAYNSTKILSVASTRLKPLERPSATGGFSACIVIDMTGILSRCGRYRVEPYLSAAAIAVCAVVNKLRDPYAIPAPHMNHVLMSCTNCLALTVLIVVHGKPPYSPRFSGRFSILQQTARPNHCTLT